MDSDDKFSAKSSDEKNSESEKIVWQSVFIVLGKEIVSKTLKHPTLL